MPETKALALNFGHFCAQKEFFVKTISVNVKISTDDINARKSIQIFIKFY